MVTELNIKNKVTGDSLDFSYCNGQYLIDEIDWGTVEVTANTYKVPTQVGVTLDSISVGSRNIVIYGTIIGDSPTKTLGMKWEDVYKARKESLDNCKQDLDKIISVHEDVVLTANGYTIEGRPSIPVKYSTEYEKNNEVMCGFEIDILCSYPLFKGEEKSVQLAYIKNKFTFPFHSCEPDDMIVFGEVVRVKSGLCENNGDEEVGATITISASGGQVVNPTIRNVNTGEEIGFSGLVLEDGDRVVITTSVNEENVIHHIAESGTDENVVANMTENSVFLQIPKRGSYFTYDVEQQYEGNIEISIDYIERYYNIRGM